MIRTAARFLAFPILLLTLPVGLFAQKPPYDVFPPAEAPYYRVRYEPSTNKGELPYGVNYTIWIPPNVKTLRGVIVHQHGCGEGSCKSGLTGAYDLHWQALARKHGCALLSPSYEQPEKADCQMWCDPRNGSDATFRKCLVDLGAKSGHPELAKAPWALWGHSGGGHWAGGMVMLHPDRVAAAWLRSGVPLLKENPKGGTIKSHTLPAPALKVPMMCNLGTKEGVTVKDKNFAGVWPANEVFFNEVRGKGGLVGVAVDPLSSHDCGNQRYLAIPWLDACLTARLPKTTGEPLVAMPTDKSWLALPTGAEAVPATSLSGEATKILADPLKAAWLPNEAIAKAWMQYVKDSAVADTTPPPAPTNARLRGNELTWEAEADLESGLASFIIERDGQFLANLPEQGKNPFGRPVFQNLQYSDTPTQPLVAMKYTDTKAEAGKKHVYRIIAVNTAGLKSKASADATVVFDHRKPADTNLVFRNATIYDGSGKPGFKGDVHVKGDRIAAVGEVGKIEGATEIDAAGLVICPGFIDLHTHCDPGLPGKVGRANKNYVTQGCTTVVTGNCGSGPVDAGKFFKTLDENGVGTNVIHLAPHNSIRSQVMGNINRAPTADELKKMQELTDRAMKDGTWGLATGLIYNPGTYSKTDELIALASVAAKHDGLYASHIRDESGGLLDAIEEAVTIGKTAGCRVHISHIKASGKSSWGKSAEAVAVIDSYRKKGMAVTADQYPYIASSTSLRATVVPTKYREGTDKEFVARLDDPEIGPKIRADVEKALGGRDGGKRIQIARYAPNPKWQGKNLAAIAEDEKKQPVEIALEIERNGGAQIVNFGMSEDDVRIYMRQPWVATASDGGVQVPGDTVPHPRSYGTFPRKIGFYAIEEKLVPVEAAIRSSTGLPADILKLTDRGYLKSGYLADLVVFDPQTYRDTATFDKPHQYAAGVKWVLVNGHAEIQDGKYSGEVLGGRVLRHPGK